MDEYTARRQADADFEYQQKEIEVAVLCERRRCAALARIWFIDGPQPDSEESAQDFAARQIEAGILSGEQAT